MLPVPFRICSTDELREPLPTEVSELLSAVPLEPLLVELPEPLPAELREPLSV